MRKIGTRRRRARALQALHSIRWRSEHTHGRFVWTDSPDPFMPDVGRCVRCGTLVRGGRVTLIGGSSGVTGSGGRATVRGRS